MRSAIGQMLIESNLYVYPMDIHINYLKIHLQERVTLCCPLTINNCLVCVCAL